VAKIYLVRHAHAGVPGEQDGPDTARSLTERGWRQAEGLVELLGGTGATRLVSSPIRRCVQTLQPLAAHLRTEVVMDPRLAEGRGFEGALALLEELEGVDAVLCSHGDVIPDVLEALVRRGMRLKDPARWQKASTWVLSRSGPQFTKAKYLPPPA